MLSLTFSLLVGVISVLAVTFPQPLPLTGSATTTHDPAIIYNAQSKYYYLFSTGGGVARSTNLQGPWSSIGPWFPNGCSVVTNAGHCDLWAPDVHLLNGQYYLYYASSTGGSQDSVIGVATSATMESGSWTDHGVVFSSSKGKNYNAIDPNLIQEKNGTLLMTFGSFWADIFQFQLASSGLAPISSSPTLTPMSFNATYPQPEEGSFVYSPPGSTYYYLFFSSGSCCGFVASSLPHPGDEYKVFVGRSTSPSGPFVDKNGVPLVKTGGTLVLASHDNIYAPGGQSLFRDPKTNRDVMAYHWIARNNVEGSSYLGLNFVDFSSGWPVLVN